MRADAHISIARAEVRGRDIGRYAAARFDNGRALAIAGGLGMPRLWSVATDAALAGFGQGFAEPATGGEDRLHVAMMTAQSWLATQADRLIEKRRPDAMLVGLFLDNGMLHVESVGPARVYLSRAGHPQRLTPREDAAEGLLHGSIARCETALEPDDNILVGSVSAFSITAIGKLASVLEADPRTPPSVLASLLTEPAGKAGVGAVAAVLRIR